MSVSTHERPAPPRGHFDRIRGLWRSSDAGRLPHALLLHGPRGIGKYRSARYFALGLFCRDPEARVNGPCGICGPCKRFASGSHPDAFAVDPVLEEREIIPISRIAARDEGSKEELQSVEDFLNLRAAEGGWRVLMIRECDRMNSAAQNALLKMLEEPAPGVLCLLETSRPGGLLDTVRSRCTAVVFPALDREDARAVLLEQGVDPAACDSLARWSGGSPGEALRLLEGGIEDVHRILLALLSGKITSPEGAKAFWNLDIEGTGSTPTARLRSRARFALDLATVLLLDRERVMAGVDPRGLRLGAAFEGPDGAHWAMISAARAEAQREELLEACLDLSSNVAPEAALERAFLALTTTAGGKEKRAGRVERNPERV